MDQNNAPPARNLLLTAVLIIIALAYSVVTIRTRDPLWFVPTFNEVPEDIFINCYGELATIHPDDPAFAGLVTVVNTTLSSTKYFDPLTMSDEIYEYYLTGDDVMALELLYSPQVRIHSFYRFFSNLDSIVIPLDGLHAGTNAIFGRTNDRSTDGSLHYDRMPDVRAFVETEQICVKP